MIYLDSSALVKLVRTEDESPALWRWLVGNQQVPWCCSALCRVEVPRAVGELGPDARRRATDVLAELEQLPLNEGTLDAAAAIPGRLRSLDAIHLAAALRRREDLTAFVAYDHRLLAAATETGLPVVSPGAA